MPDDLSSDFFVAHGERDPLRSVKNELRRKLPKRFYTEATSALRENAFAVLLDGKPVRTPAGNPLALPSSRAAELVAAEWQGQGAFIDPSTMPVTRLVNTALDGVARDIAAVEADIVKFSASDLVCYRAGEPDGLVAAQSAAWDPALAFAREKLGARFVLAGGVMFVPQPPEAIAAVARAVARFADAPDAALRVACLHLMTTLLGSALLALMAADGAATIESAWAAAHVDEDFQMARWGEDYEARAKRAARFPDLKAAGDLLAAL